MGFNMLQHLVNVLFSLKRIEGDGDKGCLLCINLYEKSERRFEVQVIKQWIHVNTYSPYVSYLTITVYAAQM